MSKVTKEINKISMAVIGISGRIVLYALIVLLLVLGARKGYLFGHSIFYAPAMDNTPGIEKTVTLDGTESLKEVGKILEDIGLIRDSSAFAIQAKCYGYEVQGGTWHLNTSLSSKEIIGLLGEDPEGDES